MLRYVLIMLVAAALAPAADPIDKRIDALLARMTLEEKVGQMNMPCLYVHGLGKDIPAKQAGVRKFAAGTLVDGLGPGGGFFTLANQILHNGPRQQAEFFNELQRSPSRRRGWASRCSRPKRARTA